MDTTSLVIPLVILFARLFLGSNGTFAVPVNAGNNANARLMDTIFKNIILGTDDNPVKAKPYSKVSVDDLIEPPEDEDEDDDEELGHEHLGGPGGFVGAHGLVAPRWVPNKDEFEARMRDYTKRKLKAANSNANDEEVLDFLYHSKLALYRGQMCASHPKEFVALVDTSAKMTEEELLGIQKTLMLIALGMSAARVTNNNHLSLVTYNTTAKHHFAKLLLTKKNQENIQSRISAAFEGLQPHGVANTGHALRYAREKVFSGGNSYLAYDNTRNLSWDQVLGRNLHVLIFTKGTSHDSNVFFEEANIIKRNGGRIIMFVSNDANRIECRLITNCPGTEYCNNYLRYNLSNLMEAISSIMTRVCGAYSRDAVCLERWSEYGPCSVTCGIGLRDSHFEGFTTLLPATDAKYGKPGKSCEEQYANVVKRQILCTLAPCNPRDDADRALPGPSVPVTTKVDLDAPETVSTEGVPIPPGAETDAAGHPGQGTLETMGHKENDPDGTQVNVVLQPGVPTESEAENQLEDFQQAELNGYAGANDIEQSDDAGALEPLPQGVTYKPGAAAHLGPRAGGKGFDLTDLYGHGPVQDAQDQVLRDEDLLDRDARRLARDKDQLQRDAGWVAHDEAQLKRDQRRLAHDREHLHQQRQNHHHHKHNKQRKEDEDGEGGWKKNKLLFASLAGCLIVVFGVAYFVVYKRRGGAGDGDADEESELLNSNESGKPERGDYKVESAESKIWE